MPYLWNVLVDGPGQIVLARDISPVPGLRKLLIKDQG